MKKIVIPSVFKTKAFKRIRRWETEAPKVRITPIQNSKDEKKKAKLIEKIMNYAFEKNTNGITSKYMQVMRLSEQQFMVEQFCEYCGAKMSGKLRTYAYEEGTGKPKTTIDWKCPNSTFLNRLLGSHMEPDYG